ncbi:Multicopper oxidase with three cupredoxin domains (includes cell division protein FtsP and spore coat protein CotA) [Thalassobacillus cyri]|uniref:Multicopper oxidase with three cupredoxin domains (Includes cell division protein FtsP and spore coat protein CotA) n=1 Tax=Thalassobacillus cyri TaxID=571932 RepID=A0A1H3ZL63_9BACI|nr:multicopper oxidase domain-containing protein [Thalassobacillus cyri]SEA24536.1 Multicopper oxidase with three cupredoxin domains (includes cell division protein FtsP and spore coat protein CotA) [Thalassobacillus cyri]
MKKSLITIVVIIIAVLYVYTDNRNDSVNHQTRAENSGGEGQAEENAVKVEAAQLPIPPLLEDKNPDPDKAEFHLTAQQSTKEFLKGKETETLGYNGDYLGPVIKARKGEEVSVKVKNKLDEATTVHWHGLEVNGKQDGGPHSGIQSGESWNPKFTIDQPAATLWYHPHLLHKTGEQVYMGLAGLFYIEDEISESLDIPKEYGVNDIPLVIQDKQLFENGTYEYDLTMHDIMMGLQGNVVLVNGAIQPYLEVPKGKVRLRLLNGSNAKTYDFQLSDGESFQQIASDGGFLEKPVEMSGLTMSAAERAEIIVDFSDYETGDIVELSHQDYDLMKFVVTDQESKEYTIPEKLTDIPEIDTDTAVRTREFVMSGMGRSVSINGKQMDMDRVDEEVKLGDTEIWEVSNDGSGMMGGMPHPFHVHGVQFRIIDRGGDPPPPNERGWKDTVNVYPGEMVRLIATFDHSGLFMYHCHILEHEDSGMMGQYEVDE